MIKLPRLVIIVAIIIITSCIGQEQKEKFIWQKHGLIHSDLSSGLNRIVSALEEGNRVESSHIGESSRPSNQWEKYEQLGKLATTNQLVELTSHKNSVVRCYAFQALAAKRSGQTFKVLLNHLNDTSKIEIMNGCIGMRISTGDYFIDVVTPNRIEVGVYKLNSKEQEILDSTLLNDKSILLSAKSSMLENLKPTGNNYEKIKQLVKDDRNGFALRTFAKYQRQADIKLIASFFKNETDQYAALFAAREFPDEYFFTFVKDVFEQEWKKKSYDYARWKLCYQTLAKYPQPQTIELFDRTTSIKDKFRYQILCTYMLVAITKYPNKLYDSVREKIKLNPYQMNEVKKEIENDY